jgi:hypothetical protein
LQLITCNYFNAITLIFSTLNQNYFYFLFFFRKPAVVKSCFPVRLLFSIVTLSNQGFLRYKPTCSVKKDSMCDGWAFEDICCYRLLSSRPRSFGSMQIHSFIPFIHCRKFRFRIGNKMTKMCHAAWQVDLYSNKASLSTVSNA